MRCQLTEPNKLPCKIVIVGEAPGQNEAKKGIPFIGKSGQELTRMLEQAGIDRSSCMLTNVFMDRPPGTGKIESLCGSKKEVGKDYALPALSQGNYVKPEYLHELDRLKSEIEHYGPNIVIALGNTALWALCQVSGIGKFRGTVVDGVLTKHKVIPTWHPAGILRNWSWRPETILDLMKCKAESEFPEVRRPKREIWIDPTIDDLYEYEKLHFEKATLIAADIEVPDRRFLHCISFSPDPWNSLVVPFVNSDAPNPNYWSTLEEEIEAWNFVQRIFQYKHAVTLGQNFLFDVQHLLKNGIIPWNFKEDTMLCHHAFSAESTKSLGFMISLYTNERASKLLAPKGGKTNKREE